MNIPLISDNSALNEYKRIYPMVTPSIFQQEMIEQCITDIPAWREVLEMWAGNDYRPQSIAKMIECYDKKIQERDSTTSYNHVRNQPTQRQAIAEELERVQREIDTIQ